jgi:hypothetical protein
MLAGAVLAAAGGLLETILMARQAVWLHTLGVICGHQGGLAVVHCPGCYVAAAMVLGGLALALTGATRTGLQPAYRAARRRD